MKVKTILRVILGVVAIIVLLTLTRSVANTKNQLIEDLKGLDQRIETLIIENQKLIEDTEELEKQFAEEEKRADARVEARLVLEARQNSYKPSRSCEDFRPIIEKYNWPVEEALAICGPESGGNIYAANTTDRHRFANGEVCIGSYGLFQIACFDGVVYDPEENIAIAYRKWDSSGWYPWKNTAIKIGLL